MQMHYRQGDVLLIRVEAIPKGAEKENGPVILAHGEVTGHAHRIKSRSAKVFAKAGERFLSLAKSAALVHEEHGTVSLEPGFYRIVRQREYSPEEIRQVAD